MLKNINWENKKIEYNLEVGSLFGVKNYKERGDRERKMLRQSHISYIRLFLQTKGKIKYYDTHKSLTGLQAITVESDSSDI